MKRNIFVFGSNSIGLHGAGAAKYAKEHYGAINGVAYGLNGNSFAIPTKNGFINKQGRPTVGKPLSLDSIYDFVRGFISYAMDHKEMNFKVTRIGCGLAGYKDEQIAPMFRGAPANCWFDTAWKNILGSEYKYWGTK